MKFIEKNIKRSIGTYYNFLAHIHPRKVMKDGFDLFCTPFAPKLKSYQQEFLETGKNQVINVDSVDIQTYQWGNGSKHVLLVHGWASHTYRWKAYIKGLVENNFTVHALDAPAHGNSRGKLLNIIIYERVINQFIQSKPQLDYLIGHSIGGFTSTYYLSSNPLAPIKKAVILAAPGEATEFFTFYANQLGLTHKTITLIADQLEHLYGKRPDYFNSELFGRKINIPALIIHDQDDKSTNFINSKKLHNAWSQSDLIITEGQGHELKSEDVIEAVIKYLD
jgi:pimeloyl-ACP methyl ester carboxylesterase